MWNRLRLFQHRTVWFPTGLGLICFALFLAVPVFWCWIYGEAFLSSTSRLPAEILVVEGWIGRTGVRAAAVEFEKGAYQYVVTTGGLLSDRWRVDPESYAVMAEQELIQCGIPEKRIIVATTSDTENRRTFESAVAVRGALQAKGIHPKKINVFTRGPHARRSRLIFAKVNLPETQVGVISWNPKADEARPWWRSSERSRELIAESVGYLYEALFNSGRCSDTPNNPEFRKLSGVGTP
jgi:uncharacterized SAM-binding protein YcdF (DUF218 family)